MSDQTLTNEQQIEKHVDEAMREVPSGAGSCQHCGTGILHHVVIEPDDNLISGKHFDNARQYCAQRGQRLVAVLDRNASQCFLPAKRLPLG